MTTLDLEFFTFLYLSSGILVIFGLWWCYERRWRSFYREERSRILFHCVRCGALYTEGHGAEVALCPDCGFKNTRLRF